jgi:nucleoside-diphosphate-sugar epimerase
VHLVIGATGYAGRHAVTVLGEHDDVRGAEPGDDLAEAMSGVDVVHFAAERRSPFDVPRRERRPDPFLVEVVAAARAAGVRRIVYLSTAHVYGFAKGEARFSERTKLRPQHPYERAAARDEAWLHEQTEPETVVLRAAQGFGAGEPVLACLLRRLASGRLLLPGGGAAPRTFLAGRDLGHAFHAAATRGQAGVAYLAGGFTGCWRELLQAAAAVLRLQPRLTWLSYDFAYLAASARSLRVPAGHECWVTPFLVDVMGRQHLMEDGWSRRELSWEPEITAFADGLEHLRDWFEVLNAAPAPPERAPAAAARIPGT